MCVANSCLNNASKQLVQLRNAHTGSTRVYVSNSYFLCDDQLSCDTNTKSSDPRKHVLQFISILQKGSIISCIVSTASQREKHLHAQRGGCSNECYRKAATAFKLTARATAGLRSKSFFLARASGYCVTPALSLPLRLRRRF
eukprot:TRINITY_DN33224_c0_g1_i1.p1 TRINITY_DN33224_c0_g1~~TRINITY_DN33224_c0_g1_i1.p1  ORF type:complete len:142 (-),score=5.18 TRINITY_DN33224_c0_g1_i1:126-551(-)